MKLSKLEKLTYVGCPWLFGVVFVIVGALSGSSSALNRLLCSASGLLFISLFCICSLLLKLIEK